MEHDLHVLALGFQLFLTERGDVYTANRDAARCGVNQPEDATRDSRFTRPAFTHNAKRPALHQFDTNVLSCFNFTRAADKTTSAIRLAQLVGAQHDFVRHPIARHAGYLAGDGTQQIAGIVRLRTAQQAVDVLRFHHLAQFQYGHVISDF